MRVCQRLQRHLWELGILKRLIVSPAVYPRFLEIAELARSLCHSWATCYNVFYLWRKHDVSMTLLYFQQDIPPAQRARDATELRRKYHFRLCTSARHVATELTRHINLVDYATWSVTQERVWDHQNSWHRWAATAFTVVQLGAVADWWCSWPMSNTLCVLMFVPEADILNILCDC